MSRLALLRLAAAEAPVVMLQREEPHPVGMALGLLSVVLGIWLSRSGAADPRWAWLALGGTLVGMALYVSWKHLGAGWRVDFAARRLSPIGQPGADVAVEGEGWMVRTGPGTRFAHMAVDLMHNERGMVARLYEHAVLRRSHRKLVSALADSVAERLGAERTGPRY